MVTNRSGRVGAWSLCRVFLVALALVPVPAAAQAPPLPKVPADLQELRAALQKYEDPILAIHDGYFSTLGCLEFTDPPGPGDVPTYAVGAMGVHFLNPAFVGPEPDPKRPPVLLYEPVGDKLRLVGVEWFVPLATGVKKAPTLYGHVFDGPMEGHHPVLPLNLHHYDLHVWLWRENPNGLYKPTNPAVKCGNYGYTVKLKAGRLVSH